MAHSEVPVVIPTEVIEGLQPEEPVVPTDASDEGVAPPAPPAPPAATTPAPAPAAPAVPATAPPAAPATQPPDTLELIHETIGEVRDLGRRLDTALTPPAAPAEPAAPLQPTATMKALMESESVVERAIGEEMWRERQDRQRERDEYAARVNELEAEIAGTQQVIAAAQAQAEIADAAQKYELTGEQVMFVVESMERSGSVNSLTFEQGVRVYLPDATPKARPASPAPPAVRPGAADGNGPPPKAATIVDRAAAAGAAPKEAAPKEYASVEDAVGDGWARIFGTG